MTSVSSFQGMMVSMSSRNCSLRVFLRYFSKPSVRVGCRMFSDSQRFLDCGIIAKNHRRINQSFLKELTSTTVFESILTSSKYSQIGFVPLKVSLFLIPTTFPEYSPAISEMNTNLTEKITTTITNKTNKTGKNLLASYLNENQSKSTFFHLMGLPKNLQLGV